MVNGEKMINEGAGGKKKGGHCINGVKRLVFVVVVKTPIFRVINLKIIAGCGFLRLLYTVLYLLSLKLIST